MNQHYLGVLNMSEYITIPLSKTGKKNAGKYEAIVSLEDTDLSEYNWAVVVERKTQYASRLIMHDGKRIALSMHRVILERIIGRPIKKDYECDHINGNGLDNRRENLREVTRSQNAMNVKYYSTNVSGYKGVSHIKKHGKYRAAIGLNGDIIYLGEFDTPEQAHKAYCEAAKELHGDFANFGSES